MMSGSGTDVISVSRADYNRNNNNNNNLIIDTALLSASRRGRRWRSGSLWVDGVSFRVCWSELIFCLLGRRSS